MSKIDLSEILWLPLNVDETWEGGVVSISRLFPEMPSTFGGSEMMLAVWRSSLVGLVHARPFAVPAGDRDALLDEFLESLLEFHDLHAFSHRPKQLQCNDQQLTEELAQALRATGLEVVHQPHMSQWDEVLREMAEQWEDELDQEELMPSLAALEIDDDQVRLFAQASASFYRARLWELLDDVDLIAFESPRPPKSMRFAVILGAGAQTYGLGFYADEEDHYGLMAERAHPGELSVMSLSYESVSEVAPQDVQLWRDLDLPLETSEAFPTFCGFSSAGPRQPTLKEFEYATIVLLALSETTEEEIDSGSWTKSIEYRGKKKQCKFSIPNLLDPPDRAEWMRRGQMPERRGNERFFDLVQGFVDEQPEVTSIEDLNKLLNEKFTGSMDDFEYPMDTPADRANAKCQEAINSFGRRRVQLARQALGEDPNHVESLVLLAESTRNPEERIKAFQQAADAGRRELGEEFDECVGHFWGNTRTRPFMRACHGLAHALDKAGRTNEAIAQYRELLRLNPDDNQGIRYEVIPLMISHNRESDAFALLDEYREDSALWHYMKSLADYRAHGPQSRKAQLAMKAAFSANKYVVQLLQSDFPPCSPSSYSPGSEEEAMVCIESMYNAWSETAGFLEFMDDQYFKWEKERQKRKRDLKRKARRKAKDMKKRKRR